MAGYEEVVADEIASTLDRAGFETLSRESFRIEVTDSFQRRLGECRPVDSPADGSGSDRYRIRIARRLFDDDYEADWRDTVRHEVAHASVFSRLGRDVQPHGDEWEAAARRAGADPSARYEGEDVVDAEYVLACPAGCYERKYVQRAKRIKHPWQYTCPECESQLVSYDEGSPPTTLDPGTCYVASIPWNRRDEQGSRERPLSGRYLLGCPNGCTAWPYQKRSKRIKHPWLYACPECEATLVSCDGRDAPTSFEPGTCHVESIPWTEPRFVHACPNGCFRVGHAQHSGETRRPEKHRCEECDARTVSYPAGQRPDNPTPGTNYVD